MLLESLLECVNGIRGRIDAHGPAFRRSEAQTRYALIDPLLRELGWDTQNPNLVVPEYNSGNGRADYALLNGGKPAMMVEAKSLDTPLQGVVAQGIQYCLMEGTGHFSVTDGRRWEIYETHKAVPIDEKRIVSFDLQGQPASEACLQALVLWRPSVQAGRVGPGCAPVVVGIPSQPTQPEPPQPPPPPPPMHDWTSLLELEPESGDSNPIGLMFPDGSTSDLASWRSMLIRVTDWLIGSRHVTSGRCPIPYSNRSKGYIVGIEPLHADGSQFSKSGQKRIGSFYVDTHHSAKGTAKVTRTVIEHVGQDPAQFKVRFP